MKVNKKKVSFDIEVDTLNSIKAWCIDNKVKQSDFYREAAIKHLADVNLNKELYFFDSKNNKMLKLNVKQSHYDFEYIDAGDDIKSAFGIKRIVLVKKKENINENTPVANLVDVNGGLLKCFEK